MDSEASRKQRLSFVDWLILGAVLLALLGGIWALRRMRGDTGETIRIRYTVRLSAVAGDESFDAVQIGDAVTSENGTAPLGTVTEITVRPHLTPSVKSGQVVFVERPGRVDIDLTVTGDGTQREGDGMRLSDIRIAAGIAGGFRFGAYYADGRVIEAVAEVAE